MKNNLSNLSNNFSNSTDILGIGKVASAIDGMVGKVLEYKKFKIQITDENKESLFHVIKKDRLNNNKKVELLLEKILKIYEEKSSIPTNIIKFIEYLDDETLEALILLEPRIIKEVHENYYIPPLNGELGIVADKLLRNQILQRTFYGTGRAYDVPPAAVNILEIYNS